MRHKIVEIFAQSWDCYKRIWPQIMAAALLLSFFQWAVTASIQIPVLDEPLLDADRDAEFLWPKICYIIGVMILKFFIFLISSGIIDDLLKVAIIRLYFTRDLGFWSAISAGLEDYGRGIKVSFITGLLIFGGFLAFVVPGFIFLFRFMFSVYAAVIDKLSLSDAIAASNRLVKNDQSNALLFIVCVIGIHIVGSMVLAPLNHLNPAPETGAIYHVPVAAIIHRCTFESVTFIACLIYYLKLKSETQMN